MYSRMVSCRVVGFAMVQPATHDFDIYQSRNPKASAYYKCVENSSDRKLLAELGQVDSAKASLSPALYSIN